MRLNFPIKQLKEKDEKIGKKIRDTEVARVPYMLIIGEKEVNENKVSVRRQGKGDAGAVDADEFISSLKEEITNRTVE